MSLNFPNNPVVGDTHNGINNIQYVFDGEKWTTVGSTAGPSPSFDAITVTGVATFAGDVERIGVLIQNCLFSLLLLIELEFISLVLKITVRSHCLRLSTTKVKERAETFGRAGDL